MDTEITTVNQQTRPPSALAAMASRFNVDPGKLLETLKATVFKNASPEQLMALVVVSNEFGLNPFCREIYAFPDKSGGIVPVVSIDGWINRMNQHPQFDGVEFEWAEGGDGKPISCTAIVHRKDRTKATRVTEFFAECFRATDPWKQAPHRMLRHRALIQAARIAFGFSGMDPEDAMMAKLDQVHGRVVEVVRPKFAPRLDSTRDKSSQHNVADEGAEASSVDPDGIEGASSEEGEQP